MSIRQIIYVVAILAAIAAIASLFAVSTSEQTRRMIVAAWTVGPPIFFFLEYLFTAPDPALNAAAFERFKYSQELAARVWVAVTAVLAALYFGNNRTLGGRCCE